MTLDVREPLAEGLSNKAMATRLDISDQTVKFQVASMWDTGLPETVDAPALRP